MAKIERCEDLIAWQKARQLTQAIYQVTHSGATSKDYALASQMQRAAVSTISNIAEGFERSRPAEFHQFLSTAKGSCGEVRSLLRTAFDAGYLDPAFQQLMSSAIGLAKVVAGLRQAVERQQPLPATREEPALYDTDTQHSTLSTQDQPDARHRHGWAR